VKKKMHSKEHMYVSGLEISRAAAASHKVGKEKREPRDFKVKKEPGHLYKRDLGLFFAPVQACVMCMYTWG
jgi:hypothetical protein